MRSSSPFIIFLLFIIPVTAFSQWTLPFFEDFNESTCDSCICPFPADSSCFSFTLPAGWTFPDPNNANPGNWRVGERGWTSGTVGGDDEVIHFIGNDPPAAYFYWSNTVTNYGGDDYMMTTPTIYVGDEEQVKVFFDMELDYYAPNSRNGLNVKYRTPGLGWQTVLGYEVPQGVNVNFRLRTDSYIANVTDSIQLGFEAQGVNSVHINSWDIDNVTVTALPKLLSVSIRSDNALDSTLAVPTDTITLSYTANEPLTETSAIIAGTPVTSVGGGMVWQAKYEVKETDEDGPVSFVTIFKAQYTVDIYELEVDGNPKTTTTDNSLVVIDRTGPGEFEVGAVNTFEALQTDTIWYSDDDSLRMLVNIPPDTAIAGFIYTSGTSLSIEPNGFVNLSSEIQQTTNAITVEAWIKPAATYENYDGFFSNADLSSADTNQWEGYGWFYFGSGWHFFLHTDSTYFYEDDTGNEWPVAAVQTGEWSHLAATYKSADSVIITYRNGIKTDQKTAKGNIVYPLLSPDVWIGKFKFGPTERSFDGKIDEVRIWNVARTQTEIQGYMNQSLSGNEPGLIGYWRFDQGTGGTINDASNNNNDGTISGSAVWDINDSPIDFREDSLAFDKLVGAYVQLTADSAGLSLKNIGNVTDNVLSAGDIAIGHKIVSATDIVFESIIGTPDSTIDSTTYYISAKIIDQAGNPKLGNNTQIITVDNRSPSIDSAYIIDTDNMIINFSEGLFQSDNGTGAVQKTEFQLDFEQNENNGGTANIMGDSLISISKVPTGDLEGGEYDILFDFAVDTVASGDETAEITVQNSTIFDQYGNQMLTIVTTGPIFLNDLIAPYVENSTIDTSNAFVKIIFNESVYSAVSASIDSAHFDSVLFDFDVGDHATDVSITGVTKNDGSPLEGGEDTIRVNLDVTGAPSGTETITIRPILNKIKDRGTPPNFLTDSSGILYLYKYPWIDSVESVNNLDENNAFVEIIFSDTVFSGSGGALDSSDFSGLNFQLGADGNAEAATITDITNTNNIVLNTGEDTIRVYLDITGIPSGTETIKIGPLNDTSIVNSINNPLDESDTLLFTLKDKLLPTIDSASINNENDFILFYASEGLWTDEGQEDPVTPEDFELGFNQNFNMGGTVHSASILSLKKEDGSSLDGGEKIIKINLFFPPPVQLASGDEQILVKVKNGTSIYDRNGNPMDSGASTDSLTLHDRLPPGIDSLRIINSNEYANLYFSEGIYDSSSDSIGIGVFGDLNFLPGNDPGATDVQIDSLRKSNGNPLTGGETQIRVYLTVSGIPSGTESIGIEPQDSSIKDLSNNYMSTIATGRDSLNSFPRIIDSTLSDENSYVQLILSEEIFNLSNGPLSSSDFIIDEFDQNSGNAEDAIISSITDVNNNLLTTGEDTIRLGINLMNPPASGVEEFKIRPLTNFSIINEIGNALEIIPSSRIFFLNDRFPPYIYPNTTLIDDTTSPLHTYYYLVIQTNEKIYTDTLNNEGISKVEISDFHLEFYNNGGNATNAFITGIYKDTLGTLLDPSGGDSIIFVQFSLFGALPSGVEEVELSPNSPASIYDESANPMLRTSTSGKELLPDRIPPKINLPTADIPDDNSYVIITLTEGVYGDISATTPVDENDFSVEFITTSNYCNSAQVSGILNSLQNPLVGGEDTLYCYLDFAGTPGGGETFYIKAADTNSVFDANRNALEFSPNSWEVDQNTDTLRLNDQVVPEIKPELSTPNDTTISSSIGLPIKLVFNEPVISFSYSVSASHYNYLTYSDTTTATTFKLNLHPPLASLDTITLTLYNLTDSVGNVNLVNPSYTYFTPALGDYDIDDRVTVEDLAQFVSFWMADSQPLVLGLGPTSGTFPHLVPNLDDKYDLDDGMTFIRMWSWSVDRFGLEPSASPPIGIAINWDKLVVDVPTEAIAGQVYLRYNPLQGKVDLNHAGFGNNNLTMKREAIENGEILLEFGLVDPDDDARVISIKTEINEPADATVIYKFFGEDQSLIAAGTQKIALVIPTEFRLMQNYPNPFNNTTIIPYAVPEETFVQLEIFDINGRHVQTLTSQFHQPGFHTLHWSGRSAASGVYFIKLEAAKTVLTQKMILLK